MSNYMHKSGDLQFKCALVSIMYNNSIFLKKYRSDSQSTIQSVNLQVSANFPLRSNHSIAIENEVEVYIVLHFL